MKNFIKIEDSDSNFGDCKNCEAIFMLQKELLVHYFFTNIKRGV